MIFSAQQAQSNHLGIERCVGEIIFRLSHERLNRTILELKAFSAKAWARARVRDQSNHLGIERILLLRSGCVPHAGLNRTILELKAVRCGALVAGGLRLNRTILELKVWNRALCYCTRRAQSNHLGIESAELVKRQLARVPGSIEPSWN